MVTGKNCLRYYRMNEAGVLSQRVTQLSKKDQHLQDRNYTCHAWLDNHLLVCTDRGEILFCD